MSKKKKSISVCSGDKIAFSFGRGLSYGEVVSVNLTTIRIRHVVEENFRFDDINIVEVLR